MLTLQSGCLAHWRIWWISIRVVRNGSCVWHRLQRSSDMELRTDSNGLGRRLCCLHSSEKGAVITHSIHRKTQHLLNMIQECLGREEQEWASWLLRSALVEHCWLLCPDALFIFSRGILRLIERDFKAFETSGRNLKGDLDMDCECLHEGDDFEN